MAHETERLMVLESEVKRLKEDRLADWQTQGHRNTDYESRLRFLESHWYKASGALIAISALLQIIFHYMK